MRRRSLFVTSFFFTVVSLMLSQLIVSCEYDREEDEILVEETADIMEPEDSSEVDTSDNSNTPVIPPAPTYENKIKAIIDLNCVSANCHGEASQLGDYTSYQGVKIDVDNGKMKDRVVDGNPSFMPLGGDFVPSSDRKVIEKWLLAGAIEK